MSLFFFDQAYSQDNIDFFDAETMENYQITRYTTQNGLKQDIINNTYLDENNFLWLMTPSGIARFDGFKFEYYNSGKGSLSRISDLGFYNDKTNEFIIRFSGGVFGIISKGEFRFQREFAKNALLNYGKTVINIENIEQKSQDFSELLSRFRSGNQLISLDNRKRLIRHGDTLSIFDQGALQRTIVDPLMLEFKPGINNVYFTLQGRYFFPRSDFSILEVDSIGNSKIHLDSDLLGIKGRNRPKVAMRNCKFYTNPSHKNAFLNADNKLYEISFSNDSLRFVKLNISIDINNISDIDISDDKRNVFISSQKNGLFHLRKKSFTNSIDFDSSTDHIFYNHVQTSDGALFTNKKIKIENNTLVDQSCILPGRTTLLNDNDILYTHNIHTIKSLHVPTNECYTVFYDTTFLIMKLVLIENNTVWILSKKNAERNHKNRDFVGYLDDDNTLCIVVENLAKVTSINNTPNGRLQINTLDNIYFLNLKNGDLDSIPTPFPLEIRSVHYFDDSTALIASYDEGLVYLQNNKIFKLKLNNDKLSQSNCIIEDPLGYIWVTTNAGLFRFHKQNIKLNLRNTSNKLYFDYYDTLHGLLSNEFNGDCYPCANELIDGRLSFPSIRGLVYVDPLELVTNSKASSSVLIKTTLDNEILNNELDHIITPYFQKINFELFTANYNSEGSLHLYYKLDGYDESWILYDRYKTVSYSRLVPGSYTFNYKLITDRSENRELIGNFRFTVSKKWYQTYIAIGIFLLMFCLITYYLLRARTKYLQDVKENLKKEVVARTIELNETNDILSINLANLEKTKANLTSAVKIKNKLLAIISHEVVGGVQMIKNMSEINIQNSRSLDKSDILDSLKDINATAMNTVTILRHILVWVKNQNENLKINFKTVNVYEVTSLIINQLKAQAKGKNNEINNYINPNKKFKSDQNSLLLILHSLIENEIKHNSSSIINIFSDEKPDYFTIEIFNNNENDLFNLEQANKFFNASDDNIDELDSSILLSGLGSWIVKDLLKNIGGSIEFKNNAPNIRQTLLRFPIHHS